MNLLFRVNIAVCAVLALDDERRRIIEGQLALQVGRIAAGGNSWPRAVQWHLSDTHREGGHPQATTARGKECTSSRLAVPESQA